MHHRVWFTSGQLLIITWFLLKWTLTWKDDQFFRANNILKATMKKCLKGGQMECRNYSRIIQKDMDLLRDYFAAKLEGLKTVQEECIFQHSSTSSSSGEKIFVRSLKILLSLLILKMVCDSFDKYFVNAKECEGVAELKRIGESKRMKNDCEERQSLSSFNFKAISKQASWENKGTKRWNFFSGDSLR